ncbi:MAG: DUF5131 family protein, partial [Lachnospiraceae bacterium]|nr:DUF5131 family protein [Lachnospiraceae bacterium]
MESWNPWHGCTKYSEGCMNCYVYRMDKHYGRNPSEWTLTANLELPLKRTRDGSYKYPSGTKFFTCYTSDFFIPEADGFSHSAELVAMIRQLNRGQYLDPTVKNGLSTNFCVGVAAYPEKHFEAA